MAVTIRLTEGVRAALAQAGLPSLDDCVWEVPRQIEHGDYATNAAMVLARTARKAAKAEKKAVVKAENKAIEASGEKPKRSKGRPKPKVETPPPAEGENGTPESQG